MPESFLRPNIGRAGRIIRGFGALVMGVAAFFVWPHSRAGGVALALWAAFMAFEAVRGWCVVRACGVKTKY